MDFFQRLSQVLPSETSRWTSLDFQLFLKFIHLEEYGPQFKKFNINGVTFFGLSDEDLNDMGISNIIARTKLLDHQALLKQYDNYVNNQKSMEISKPSGFFENSICQSNDENNNSIQQSVAYNSVLISSQNNPKEQSVTMDNNVGGFGNFGNVDFFNSGTFDSKKNNDEIGNYSIAPVEKQPIEKKEGEMSILVSHYHIKPFIEDKPTFKATKTRKGEKEDEIEYVESYIVPREEIEKQKHGFSYFNKKDVKDKLIYKPNYDELILSLKNDEKTFSIKKEPFIIGNHIDATLKLNAIEISQFHAEISLKNHCYCLKDLKSKKGTWLKVIPEKPTQLELPCLIEIGSNSLSLAREGDYLIISPTEQKKFLLNETNKTISIGKMSDCDLRFPEDICTSRLHCKLHYLDKKIVLEDCKSSNGTWIRIRDDHEVLLETGMEFRLGNGQENFKVKSIYLKEELKDMKKCTACKKIEINTIIEPCTHIVLCSNCARELKVCPQCKVAIEKIIITS